ncbi:hypothetical protein CH363_13445 [Leptospira haakeii]|uniref:Uncharacterized protein n=1 Tax=Leptospira haakeii TaxID=2023198 RepID=A0ABX4PL60_9LEPT|nr:hypothetical protein CH363_13445 [Leptospira haakeii]PKA18987.1 hypothetical protein CH377_15340 [Leptospira haakeii]
MIQISEILNLIFDSIGLIAIVALYRIGLIPKYKYLFYGFLNVWFSSLFTVLEGFFWPVFLNFLEHFTFLLSGAFFLFGISVYFLKRQEI